MTDLNLVDIIFPDKDDVFNFNNVTKVMDKIKKLADTVAVGQIFQMSSISFNDKSEEAAIKLREEGNREFKDGNIIGSIGKFTTSAVLSPKNGLCFSLALSNRSLALGKLNKFKLAVEDLNLALDSGYPEKNRFKVFERKAKYLIELGQIREATQSFENAISMIDLSNLDEKEKKTAKDNIHVQKNKLYNLKEAFIKEENYTEENNNQIKQHNANIPAFSDAIQIKYDSIRGRYGVATRDISPGELLLVENPVSSHLKPQFSASHCHHCLKLVGVAPVICRDCIDVRYCSKSCMDSADSKYHKFTCNKRDYYKEFLDQQPKVSRIGLMNHLLCYKIITCQSIDYYKEHASDLLNQDTMAGAKEGKDIFLPSCLQSMSSLVGHVERNTEEELLPLLLSTVCQLRLLRETGWLVTEEDEELITKVILHFLQLMRFNTHAVVESVIFSPHSPRLIHTRSLGCGVFPSLCLLNTACDQNITKYYEGSLVRGVASKPIREGEEVSDNYFPTALVMDRESRLGWLSLHYKFQCACQACEEDLPLMSDMPTQPVNFICQGCGYFPINRLNSVCKECGVLFDIDNAEELVEHIKQNIFISIQLVSSSPLFDPLLQLNEVQRLYTDLRKIVAHPYQFMAVAEQHYLKCIRQVHGNKIFTTKKLL